MNDDRSASSLNDFSSAATPGRAWLIPALLGTVLALASLFVYLRFVSRPGLPEVSRDDLARAQAVWQERACANYDLAVRVRARQAGLYRVSVRAGIADAATLDGQPLPQQRTFETWTVPGMFATLDRDLNRDESGVPTEGRPVSVDLVVRCAFDPQFGYPAHYQRVEWGGGPEIEWEVVEFAPR